MPVKRISNTQFSVPSTSTKTNKAATMSSEKDVFTTLSTDESEMKILKRIQMDKDEANNVSGKSSNDNSAIFVGQVLDTNLPENYLLYCAKSSSRLIADIESTMPNNKAVKANKAEFVPTIPSVTSMVLPTTLAVPTNPLATTVPTAPSGSTLSTLDFVDLDQLSTPPTKHDTRSTKSVEPVDKAAKVTEVVDVTEVTETITAKTVEAAEVVEASVAKSPKEIVDLVFEEVPDSDQPVEPTIQNPEKNNSVSVKADEAAQIEQHQKTSSSAILIATPVVVSQDTTTTPTSTTNKSGQVNQASQIDSSSIMPETNSLESTQSINNPAKEDVKDPDVKIINISLPIRSSTSSINNDSKTKIPSKVKDMQTMCKEYGLAVSGNKETLTKRLTDYYEKQEKRAAANSKLNTDKTST